MTKQTESPIATVGLDMAADVATLTMEQIREGLCERCGGDPEFCHTQCARPCSFGLRFIELSKEQSIARKLPDWQVQMQQEAIQRAQTCQKYINGGHDEATAALLAGYKSTASWNTAKKKYAGQLTDLPAMKKEEPRMHLSVRITQVSGGLARFTLTENNLVVIDAPDIQTDGKNASTLPELRIFMRELQDALEILSASVEETSHED